MKASLLRHAIRLLWFGLAPLFVLAAENAALFSDLSFDGAREKAAAENKIVFLDFYTTWCGPCKELDARTWQDAAVMALLSEKTVNLKIDAEKERDLARRYSVRAYPTLLLLKPDGQEIDRLVGYRDAAKFVAEFNAALAGETSVGRARAAVANAANERERVQARYRLGEALAGAGQNDAALAEYLWCYDEGAVRSPAFAGVRLSFLLGSLEELAKIHPPARTALLERRDRTQTAFRAGSTQAAAELAALNDALDDEAANLALFDALPPGDPRRARLGSRLFDRFLLEQRYTDALEGTTPAKLEKEWKSLRPLWEPTAKDADRQIHGRRFARHWLGKHIEILAGAGRTDETRGWIKTARQFDPSPEFLAELRQHLARAGHPELLPE